MHNYKTKKICFGKRKDFFYILIAIYAFIVTFGNFFRFGVAETAIGLSTIILAIIFISSPMSWLTGFKKNKFIRVTLVLVLFSFMSALFYPAELSSPITGSFNLLVYVFLAATVSGVLITPQNLLYIFVSISVALFLASTFTLIDLFGIYNVPGVNEIKLVSHFGQVETEQASGFFARRSAMAAYYSLFIPLVIICGLQIKKRLVKLFFLTSGSLAFICLFLTHNRSGILGIILTLASYVLLNKDLNISKKIKLSFVLGCLCLILVFIMTIYFPNHIEVYIEKLSGYFGDNSKIDQEVAQSDSSRIYFFKQAIISMKDSIIGHGFAYMYTPRYGYMDPHNVLSHIIWATGILGLSWIIYSAYWFKKYFFISLPYNEFSMYFTALKYGWMAWLLNNMTHNSINMGIIWVVIGLHCSISRQYREGIQIIKNRK